MHTTFSTDHGNTVLINDSIFTAEELAILRSDTPALGHYAHFNHGSASLPPTAVFAAQNEWIESERRLGSHRAADHHATALAGVKNSLAKMLNAQAHQIALLDSASRSWSTAMSAALNGGKPLHVITTDLEYGANAIAMLLASKRKELSYSVMPARASSLPLLQLVEEALEATPRHLRPVVSLSVVSIAWGNEIVPAEVGRQIAQLVHERDGFVFLDASHAVGQIPIDVNALACDVLVFPTRKWLRGPKGVGVLYVSDHALDRLGAAQSTDAAGATWTGPNEVQTQDDARRFEGYESNPGLHLGVKAACDYAIATGVRRIAAYNKVVRASVVAQVEQRLGWRPMEDGAHATALITYRVPNVAGKGPLMKALWDKGINVAVIEPQGALWALHAMGEDKLLRLTPHYVTDESAIARLASGIEAYLRS